MLYSSIRQNIFLARNVIPSYLELASEATFPPFFPPCFAIFCAQLVCRFGYNNDPLWCMGLVGVETSTALQICWRRIRRTQQCIVYNIGTDAINNDAKSLFIPGCVQGAII